MIQIHNSFVYKIFFFTFYSSKEIRFFLHLWKCRNKLWPWTKE